MAASKHPAPRRFVRLFKWQFVALIKTGRKRQTVRPVPKRMPECGDVISLRAWTGKPYRSPQTIIGETSICYVADITIDEAAVTINGTKITNPAGIEAFARHDGFADWAELRTWFEREHGLPFHGIVIAWAPLASP